MLNKRFAKALSLTVAGHEISFDTLAEFEFCLAGRTDVPAKKVAALMNLSPDELKNEAKTIKAIEKQFVDILRKSIEAPGSIAGSLREVDAHVFSSDHSWRELMLTLNDKGAEYDELRRIALVKYMQYLTSRQDVIRHTYALKRSRQPERPEPSVSPEPRRGGEAGGSRRAEDARLSLADIHETVILTPARLQHMEGEDEQGFRRLPKGESVLLAAEAGQSIDMLLAKHKFRLTVGEELELADDSGGSYRLQEGKNIVGRDTVCNIVVSPSHRDVSRLHLIIERVGRDRIRLTDLSSHGTQLPVAFMQKALVAE